MTSSNPADLFGSVLDTPQPSGRRKTVSASESEIAEYTSPALYQPTRPSNDETPVITNNNPTAIEGPNPQDDDHLPAATAAATPARQQQAVDHMGISTSSSRTTRATNVPLNLRDGRRSLRADPNRSDDDSSMEHRGDPLLLGLKASPLSASPLLHQQPKRNSNNKRDNEDDENDGDENLQRPLLASPKNSSRPKAAPPTTQSSSSPPASGSGLVRARKNAATTATSSKQRRRRGGRDHHHHNHNRNNLPSDRSGSGSSKQRWLSRHFHTCLLWCCRNNLQSVQSTVWCMNILARLLLWATMVALIAAVFWYSYELFNHGTEPHLIAWFSAGAFVLLGFPISMWGIVSHLANYNQPHVQVYIVRILWMVPIYSIESWLAMRFHKQAIYIETLRDFYESYVLYSFLQFLIQVLGGEEALILMLKDKSPTRGFHMWGLQWCVKPWLMGQPVRKTVYERAAAVRNGNGDQLVPMGQGNHPRGRNNRRAVGRGIKRVHWKSPFFVKCKFGVLQYVLLKLVSAVAVLLLEFKGWYKEGEFSWKSGYAYICALTNLSQCWALYCLIFFYYATRTELGPIRPVGKFLSVKSLVFFTWWQSVVIALLYQWGMIPETLVNVEQDWTKEAVAKGIQDYLICIEMFVAAVVHTFVFPHTEYSPQAVEARNRALNQAPMKWTHRKKRLGRNKKYHTTNYSAYTYGYGRNNHPHSRDDFSKSSGMGLELTSLDSGGEEASMHTAETWEDPTQQWQQVQPQPSPSSHSKGLSSLHPKDHASDSGGGLSLEDDDDRESLLLDEEHGALSPVLDDEDDSRHQQRAYHTEDGDEDGGDDEDDDGYYSESAASAGGGYYDDEDDVEDDEEGSDDEHEEEDDEEEDARTATSSKPGFVSALLDSAIPRDLGDNTMGIVKGDYNVEKKTLLHHAATSDQYDLFSPNRRGNLKHFTGD